MVADGLLEYAPQVLDDVHGRYERTKERQAYLPCDTCRAVVGILLLHGGINLANSQAFLLGSHNRTAQDDGQGMLGPGIGIWETGKGIWTIGVLWMLVRFLVH